MTYRSLLVPLDNGAHCAPRTQMAIRLAQSLDAHLVGLAPTGVLDFPVVPEAAAAVGELAAQAWAALRDQAHLAADRFHAACRAAGLASHEAFVAEGAPAPALVQAAHCSDLVLLSQPDPQASGHAAARAVVEQVVLGSARPSLLLPYAGRFDTVGRRVLVAWDDSREAARAVSDALPLLQRAEQVELVAWNERGTVRDESLPDSLRALQRWLAWHGVSAETAQETTEIPIAEAMLSRAADLESDLIVMGAWGHARWTERMLGGATRGLLDAMTVPVLMSH